MKAVLGWPKAAWRPPNIAGLLGFVKWRFVALRRGKNLDGQTSGNLQRGGKQIGAELKKQLPIASRRVRGFQALRQSKSAPWEREAFKERRSCTIRLSWEYHSVLVDRWTVQTTAESVCHMDNVNQETSKRLWADEADDRLRYGKGFHWVESPVVSAYMNSQISGDANTNWVQYSAERYLASRSSPRILSLGCGGGALERDLLRLKPDCLIVAMDFSEGAISLAAEGARHAGLEIDYRVADLNETDLGAETYDVVFASGSLHHLAQLEDVLGRIRRSLTPGGLLIANEYVGPNQLQWTPRQVEIINEILALLPDRYLRRISNAADYKRKFLGPSPVAEMNQHDPTEAVHSLEILPLTNRIFNIREFKPFGGTILHMLLQDIVGNFNTAHEHDACILKLICYTERQLISAGAIPSDFAYFVAEAS